MTCSMLHTSKAAAHGAAPGQVRWPSAAGWLSHAAGLVLPLLLAGPVLAQGAAALAIAPPAALPAVPSAAIAARTSPRAAVTPIRVVVVHWKVKQGREDEFLDYWAQRSVVADRSGLVGEFLSSVEDQARFPWINMQAVSTTYTSFFNVGIWRDAMAFEDQIGKHIDLSRPPSRSRRSGGSVCSCNRSVGASAAPSCPWRTSPA